MFNNIFNPMLFNPGYLSHGMGFLGIIFFVIILLLAAFWIWMLIHAINHNIQDKPVWILVIWIMSIVGAIVYYFAIKRKCDCERCQVPNLKNVNSVEEIIISE